jgi:uncharacterized repeat protein (TIGR03803 family)
MAAGLVIAIPLCAAAAPTETQLYAFTGGGDGSFGHNASRPLSDLIQDSAGALYGTTNYGGDGCGANGIGCGTAFKLVPPAPGGLTWTLQFLTSFTGGTDGSFPAAGLTMGSGGVLYGTTADADIGAVSTGGTIFKLIPPTKVQPAWRRTILYHFKGGSNGAGPLAKLSIDANGALFGTTAYGGTSNNGTVFMLAPPPPGKGVWTQTVLYQFAGGTDGSRPSGALLIDAQGALYGTTANGGSPDGLGTVFKLTPPAPGGSNWTEQVLYRFKFGNDGGFPGYSGLVADASGALYGTTVAGGSSFSSGTVFQLNPPAPGKKLWIEKVLRRFHGAAADGGGPNSGVTIDQNGNLYGTALNGGPAGVGTVFELTPPTPGGTMWGFKSLHRFTGGADGANPWATVTVSADGTVFGTTSQGGGACPALTSNGCGTIFKITP